MSKMRTPRKRSLLTVSVTPCRPQSSRPRVCSTDMNSRLPYTETSPWPPGQTIEASSCGLRGVLDVVGVEAVVVADHDVGAAEGEVGVGEARAARRRGRRRARLRRAARAARPARARAASATRPAPPDRRSPSGFGRLATQLHVAGRGARVAEPGLEADAGVLGVRRRLLGAGVNPTTEATPTLIANMVKRLSFIDRSPGTSRADLYSAGLEAWGCRAWGLGLGAWVLRLEA